MRVNGTFHYDAPPDVVYRTFTHPDALVNATIGLQSLEEVEPDRWEAVIKVGIGGFSLIYHGTVAVVNRRPAEGFAIVINAETHNGSVDAEADLTFAPDDTGTRVDYAADINFHGAQKLLPSLARGLADYFMHGMKEYMERNGLTTKASRR